MSLTKLLIRNLIFYRRTHYGTILGTAIGTAILVGALVVGDSVRYSLQQMVLERLGKTEYALDTGGRFFRIQLADDLAALLRTSVVPLLKTRGIAIAQGGQRKMNRVEIVGVDERFGKIGDIEELYNNIADDEVIINKPLALRLNLHKGDELLLRVEKLDYLPKDAPLSLDSDRSHAMRLKVKSIVETKDFGHFNLNINQVVPNTAFVSLAMFAEEMDIKGKANVLLVSERINDGLHKDLLEAALKEVWSLTDAGLNLTIPEDQQVIELRSRRIFLENSIVDAAFRIDPDAQGIFTYFVNEIGSYAHATPYSFISGVERPIVPAGTKRDEIIINEWLAKDLHIGVGDSVTLTYYVLGTMRQLVERKSRFCVKKVVPISGIYADKELMPDFPGLANEDNCRDWNPGIPIDLDHIRTKDETYWDMHGGTPKAFITLSAARDMWQNRFGSLTAIRFHKHTMAEIKQKLSKALNPMALGFYFRPVKEEGLHASTESVDFAELFLGLSFFIILSALLLTGLLFVLGIEQRSQETGLFLALGIPAKFVRRWILSEGILLAILGITLGIFLAILYNQIVLFALKTVWRDAVGTSALHMHIDITTLSTGATLSVIISIFIMWLVIKKQTRKSITALQSGSSKISNTLIEKKPRLTLVLSMVSLIIVLIILLTTDPARGGGAVISFFMAGFLLLVSGIMLANVMITQNVRKIPISKVSLTTIGIRNNARRKGRSLSLIALLACGVFIVFTVGANRHGEIQDARQRSSGTGGFTFFAETVLPVLYDLNSEKGWQFYGINDIDTATIQFVHFRVKEGDDASCLNLNRVSTPQLIAVDPIELATRKTFTFTNITEDVVKEDPWLTLSKRFDGVIPAIADETVILWGLGKSVGDTLVYHDEAGKIFKVKLIGGIANSIFQGNLILSESSFIEKYPSQSGYRIFLIDVRNKADKSDKVFQSLVWSLQDLGIDMITTAERLAEFNKVENTYLSIFLILGGLGLILGTIGIGIIVLRNVLERRGELALLRAVGYNRRLIDTVLLTENLFLLLAGIICGVVAALIAIFPALNTPGVAIPYLTITILLFAIVLSSGMWTYFATAFALRGDLLPALRNE